MRKLNSESPEILKDTAHKYSSDEVSDIAEHLYFCEAVFNTFACLDHDQPDAIEEGAVSHLSLEARERMKKALEILRP